jgi:hypothetical protein
MSEIRVARDRLIRIADDLEERGDRVTAQRIRRVVRNKMHREPWVTHSRVHHRRMTRYLARQIRLYHTDHPHKSQQELAIYFNVGLGRVSEALNGKT